MLTALLTTVLTATALLATLARLLVRLLALLVVLLAAALLLTALLVLLIGHQLLLGFDVKRQRDMPTKRSYSDVATLSLVPCQIAASRRLEGGRAGGS